MTVWSSRNKILFDIGKNCRRVWWFNNNYSSRITIHYKIIIERTGKNTWWWYYIKLQLFQISFPTVLHSKVLWPGFQQSCVWYASNWLIGRMSRTLQNPWHDALMYGFDPQVVLNCCPLIFYNLAIISTIVSGSMTLFDKLCIYYILMNRKAL